MVLLILLSKINWMHAQTPPAKYTPLLLRASEKENHKKITYIF